MGDLVRVHRIVYDVAANWKLIHQNYAECLHCPVIHPALAADLALPERRERAGHGDLPRRPDGPPRRSSDDVDGREDDDAPCCLAWIASEHRHVYFYGILPNLLLSLHPDYMLTHLMRPIACDRTEITCDFHVHPT